MFHFRPILKSIPFRFLLRGGDLFTNTSAQSSPRLSGPMCSLNGSMGYVIGDENVSVFPGDINSPGLLL